MDADLKAKLRPLYGRKPNRIDKLLDQAKARMGNVLYAGARAHNEATAAFCKRDPRLFGVAYAPLENAQRALEEVDVAIAAGKRAIMISAGPAGEKSLGHPDSIAGFDEDVLDRFHRRNFEEMMSIV